MTEYRIITFEGRRYLQFKSKEKRRECVSSRFNFWKKTYKEYDVDVWRFIPKEIDAYVVGDCLNEKDCPTDVEFWKASSFLNSFHGQEHYEFWGITPFTKRWPNIEEYFKHLQELRASYLRRKSEEAVVPTVYL